MDQNKIFDFWQKHKLKLLIFFGFLCALGIFAQRKMAATSSRAKREYLVAKQIFERVQRGEPLSLESLDSAKKILAHHPELQAKYGTLMTFALLHQEKVAEALSYILPSFERVDNGPYTHRDSRIGSFANPGAPDLRPAKQPISACDMGDADGLKDGDAGAGKNPILELRCVYTDYGKTALLIAEENYPEAFAAADALETILSANDSYPLLRAFNLLRLVFLSEELKNEERESYYWHILQKLPSFAELEKLFQEGKISLDNYLSKDS